jgi:hypothetical protein
VLATLCWTKHPRGNCHHTIAPPNFEKFLTTTIASANQIDQLSELGVKLVENFDFALVAGIIAITCAGGATTGCERSK